MTACVLSAALAASKIFLRASAGEAAGEIRAYQLSELTLGKPSSRMVGTSGSSGGLVSEVTANILMAPQRTWGSSTEMSSSNVSTVPASKSVVADAAPR